MHPTIAKYLFYYPVTYLNGEHIARYLKEYNDFQWLPTEQASLIQQKNLRSVLQYAVHHSPYYAKKLTGINFIDDFSSVPFLTKQLLISEFKNICTPESKQAATKTTGGSTGEPVKLLKNPDALARERAATWRSYAWANVGIGDKQARFWGVPHNNKDARKAQLIDFISNRKRLSAFNLTKQSLDAYYQNLCRFKPKYLYGYVSVIKQFCHHIQEHKLPLIPSIKSIITTSEILTEADKNFIESVCGVKVFNEYGCGEVGSIAHECEHGQMHVMSDNLFVEVIDSAGNPAKTGEVVVTDFFNLATPLIRYRLGDFATLSDSTCSCGRTLPILQGIHGRAYDIIKTQEGKSVHPEALIYVFEELQQKHQAFSQFQIIQTATDHLSVNIIPTQKWSSDIEVLLQEKIHANISSSFSFTFTLCNEIKREKSGKMRVVKSEVK
jgi:phenylacetate-CoA ligase